MTVSWHHGTSPRECSNVCLSVVLRGRPGHAGSREEGSIWKSMWPKTLTGCNEKISHAFFLWLYPMYVASILAEPRPRIRECLTPRVYVASMLSCTLRSSARPRSTNKPCSYSFLTQGKIACENILRARICTPLRTGAKRGTYFISILCT